VLGATAALALSATAAGIGPAEAAAAAGVDALQVVRVRPNDGSVELLVAVPERYTGVAIPPDAFALDSGHGPIAPRSSTPVPPARSTVVVVLDNRAVIPPADLLTAQVAAVELLRGLEDGTPFAVVTTARPADLQGPTTDKDAASEAIRSVASSGGGSLSDGVSAALDGVGSDAVAPALALFTAGGQGAGPELSAQAAAAGAVLTELDASGVQPAALLPAVDELTGTLTGRQLLTFPAWGLGQATLSLSLDGYRYEAAVDLPPDASSQSSPNAASQGAPPAEASAPPKALRPTATAAPPPVRPAPASGSTGSDGEHSRSLLFSIAAALAAIAILGAGLTINRRERRARRRGALRPLGAVEDGRPNEAVPRLASGADASGTAEPGVAVDPESKSHEDEPVESESVGPEPHELGSHELDSHEPAAETAAGSLEPLEPDETLSGPVRVPPERPSRPTVRARPSRAADLPSLDDLLAWSTRGVATGRTWVVSPSAADLRARWERLVAAPLEERAELFVVDERRDLDTVVDGALPGQAPARRALAAERRGAPAPIRYARRSFDRQWLLPDLRVVDRPNVPLWSLRDAPGQLFLTAATVAVAPGGPALVATTALPQFNHFNGQRSRVWPLWLDRDGAEANLADDVMPLLEDETGVAVSAPDLLAYIAAVVAHPGYGARFARELASGAVRVPVTTDAEVLARGIALGHEVLRLQTLGEHRAPAARHRAPGPLLPVDAPVRPRLDAPLSHLPGNRPDIATYDPSDGTLTLGDGVVTDITLEVWDYEVGGMPVIEQWLGQRLTPGPRRRQSRLDLITVDAWEAGWTAELLLVLSALTGLRSLEEAQQSLLDEVLLGPYLARADVDAPGRSSRTVS
jgi:Type ISP C-terminal specificity domain